MEDFGRPRSFSYYNYGGNSLQIESYYGPQRPPPTSSSYELRSYSVSYAQSQTVNSKVGGKARGFKLRKGKSTSRSSLSKSWSISDPEFQRRKRVASYKMYGVEGKVKRTFRSSFRWLKDRYTRVVYGWW